MRNVMRKIVKARFGPCCGSAELRALRNEYIEKAQTVYDREHAAGATERQARELALAAISNMEADLLARHIPEKQLRWKTRVGIAVFSALAVLLLLAILLTHRDWKNAVTLVRSALVAVGLLAFGVICLLRESGLKFFSICCIVLGSLLVLAVLNALRVSHYDYRDKLDRIQSVELIELTKTAGLEDELEYRVLRAVDPAEWEGLIGDVARLDFEYFLPIGDPPSWPGGPIRLMIRFAPGEDGLCFAIIGDSPAIGKTEGSRVGIFDPPSTCSGWEDLSEKYGFPVQPQQ